MQLGGAESYKIISQSDCLTLDGVDDAAQFEGVKAAFDTIGMGADSQFQVRQIRASEYVDLLLQYVVYNIPGTG